MSSENLKHLALAGVFLLAANTTGSTESAPSHGGQATSYALTSSTVAVLHRSMVFDTSFERFTSALEKILGKFPAGVQEDIVTRPQFAEERLKSAQGAQQLMIFSVFDHGAALNMVNARQSAKQPDCRRIRSTFFAIRAVW